MAVGLTLSAVLLPADAVTIETVPIGDEGNVPDQDYGSGQGFGDISYA
jgi:hypothetical protein